MNESEPQRVRDVYAMRRPGDVYDLRRADVIAARSHRERVWGRLLRQEDHDLGCVVEVGSGDGSVLRWALEVGAGSVLGTDVIIERLQHSRRLSDRIGAAAADGQVLPVRSGAADTVITSTLFSSVLADEVARNVADEIGRVLRPGGLCLWFDFRIDNPRNDHVRPIGRRHVERLFPGWGARLEPVVLAPPLARRLLSVPRLAAALECLPMLRTHLAGCLIRP